MKTIVDSNSELIIKHEAYATKHDAQGKIIWVDKEKSLTHVKNRINCVIIYAHTTINEYGQTQISVVNISESDVEKRYNKIQELKNTEYVGQLPDDDLPF